MNRLDKQADGRRRARPDTEQPRTGTRMFATAIPELAPKVHREQECVFLRSELRRELSQQRSRSGSEYQQQHHRGSGCPASIQLRQHSADLQRNSERIVRPWLRNSSRSCASRYHLCLLAATCWTRYHGADLHNSEFLLVTDGEK